MLKRDDAAKVKELKNALLDLACAWAWVKDNHEAVLLDMPRDVLNIFKRADEALLGKK